MQREILGFWFRYESGEPHSEQKFPGSVVDPHFEQTADVDFTTIGSTGLSSVGTVITGVGGSMPVYCVGEAAAAASLFIFSAKFFAKTAEPTPTPIPTGLARFGSMNAAVTQIPIAPKKFSTAQPHLPRYASPASVKRMLNRNATHGFFGVVATMIPFSLSKANSSRQNAHTF